MAKITLVFSNDPLVGESIAFDIVSTGTNPYTINVLETWVNTRQTNGQITVLSGTGGIGSAANFYDAYKLDYIHGPNDVNIAVGTVTIDAPSGATFQNVVNNTGGKVSITVDNITDTPPEFSVNSVVVSQSDTDPNNKVKITTTLSEDADHYKLPGQPEVTVNTDVVVIDFPRDLLFHCRFADLPPGSLGIRYIQYPYSIRDGSYPTIPGEFITIPFLIESKFTIIITPTINGGNVDISYVDLVGLDIEYSLDDINWDTLSVFTGQPAGDYTLYIRDQYGAKISIDYSVTAIGLADPFAYISPANSISFIREEVVDNQNVFPNYTNQFDCNDLGFMNSAGSVLFTNNDNVKIQLKSNYSAIDVTLRKEGAADTIIPINQLTGNLGRYSDYDGVIYQHSSGRLGVYFENGNIYDQGNNIIGTHDLSGNVPDFAVRGNIVTVGALGGYEVFDVFFDRDIQKTIILFDSQYSGGIVNGRIKSVWNSLPYEVYDFDIDWSAHGNGLYDVVVTFTDDNYDELNMVSENITIDDEHEDTLAIFYSNKQDSNKDIFYKYDITHIARVPYIEYERIIKDKSNLVLSDNGAQLTSSELNFGFEITFGDFTPSTSDRVCIALSSENVFVNGVGCSKDGGLSLEQIEGTNLYSVSSKLIFNNRRWSNTYNQDIGFDLDYTGIAIPALLGFDGNLVKK